MTERRTFNTPLREPWNPIVYQCLRAVDCHNAQYFLTGNPWHLQQSELLRQYVRSLKDWIREEEKNTMANMGESFGSERGHEWKRSRHYCLCANHCFYFIPNHKFLYRGRRSTPLARLMGLKQGYVAIDDELVRPVPCLLPRRAFNSQRNPLKTSIDEDAGDQWPLGFCRSSRSIASFTSAVRLAPDILLSIAQRQPLQGELPRCSVRISCYSLQRH